MADGRTIGEWNSDHWADFYAAFHGVGLLAGPWFTEGGNIYRTPLDADLTIAENEGQGDYDGIISAENSGLVPPSIPKAIVTNFNVPLRKPNGDLNPSAAKPLIDAGYWCLTEAYLGDNPNATPPRLDWNAKQLGWGASQPVFGVWNASPSVYEPWAEWPGADYLGEYVL